MTENIMKPSLNTWAYKLLYIKAKFTDGKYEFELYTLPQCKFDVQTRL